MGWMVALIAGVAGVAQAALLRRAADRGPRAAHALARVLLVGVALVLAAAVGQLAAGVAGWGLAFAASVVALAWRSR